MGSVAGWLQDLAKVDNLRKVFFLQAKPNYIHFFSRTGLLKVVLAGKEDFSTS